MSELDLLTLDMQIAFVQGVATDIKRRLPKCYERDLKLALAKEVEESLGRLKGLEK